ncbi:MBL fold metallo-hydrolase [Pseudomonas aeruginosa]|nr:MBL fold metallo-hydrolase [Pseudomonas aeruginosa]
MRRAPGASGRGGDPRRAGRRQHPGARLCRRRDVRGASGCPLCYAEYRVRAAPATRLIDEGDVLDLGDRVLQVLHTPGHSPGGISLWEAATQTLFSGDIVYDGPLVEDAYHSNLDDYAASLARLRELPVRTVHGGHFASFSGERLREMIVAWFRNHDR